MAVVIPHALTLADGRIVHVTDEGLARRVETLGRDLTAKVGCWGELQLEFGRERADLVAAFVGISALALWDFYYGEGAERFDGDTEAALGELMTDLVEDCREHGLYRWPADAAALHDGCGEMMEVFMRVHGF